MIEKPPITEPFDRVAAQRTQFDACLTRRNRVEFATGGAATAVLIIVGVSSLYGSTTLLDALAGIGLILAAGGLATALSRLSSHISRHRGVEPVVSQKVALAQRLTRERDLLRSVLAWYIGPMLPGFALTWGSMIAAGNIGTVLIGIGTTVAAMAWIWRANNRVADRFDEQLHELAHHG